MTNTRPLNNSLAEAVLHYLGVKAAPPSIEALDALVIAYTWRVPWESASRIVRRTQVSNTADCPRWPEIFWTEAITKHTGGTCFESNYAFFSLLRYLGYEGYLTINNMRDSIGCHTAIVIKLSGAHYLVDVGLPVHLPLLLDPNTSTTRATPFHTYRATPQGNGITIIDRDNHPKPYCFTLIDTPLSDADYRQATTRDYDDDGLFLDRVIVIRVINGRIWRFKDDGIPYHLEQFMADKTIYHYLGDHIPTIADKVAKQFGIESTILRTAMQNTHPSPL